LIITFCSDLRLHKIDGIGNLIKNATNMSE